MEAHDRGRADDLDGRVLVRNRQKLRLAVGGVGDEGRLVFEEAVGVAVAQIIRAGYPIGTMVTLRGARMYEFLDRLITVVPIG